MGCCGSTPAEEETEFTDIEPKPVEGDAMLAALAGGGGWPEADGEAGKAVGGAQEADVEPELLTDPEDEAEEVEAEADEAAEGDGEAEGDAEAEADEVAEGDAEEVNTATTAAEAEPVLPREQIIIRNRANKVPRTSRRQRKGEAAADPDKWAFSEEVFDGSQRYVSIGEVEKEDGLISEGIERLKSSPATYLALVYQTEMIGWPPDQQAYTLVPRKGTEGYQPSGIGPDGWMTIMVASYVPLPPCDKLLRDGCTDDMAFG